MDTFTTDYHFSNHHYSYPHHESRSSAPLQFQHRLVQSPEELPRSPFSCATLGRNDIILNPFAQPEADVVCLSTKDTESTNHTIDMVLGYESGNFTEANCKKADGKWEYKSCVEAEDFYLKNKETSDFEMLASRWSDRCCLTSEEIVEKIREWSKENEHPRSRNSIIIKGVMGTISIIASSIFIWMLRRSHDGFSTTQNRLLFCLCLSDIVFSLQFLFFGMMVPKEYYSSWNARGNMVTCRISGTLFFAGAVIGPCYNVSLCALYLAIIKYEKSNEYIRAKLEPFFHLIPVVIGCGYCIYRLVTNSLRPNADGGCYDRVYHPFHCANQADGFVLDEMFLDGSEPDERFLDFPCEDNPSQIFEYILNLIPPILMIICLAMVYRKVLQTEQKMSRYGSSSIIAKKTSDNTGNKGESKRHAGILSKLKDRIFTLSSSKGDVPATTSKAKLKTRKKRSHSRMVMYKGLAYSCSWLITWGFFMPAIFFTPGSLWIYFTSVCLPLQGLFNLAIFMHPEIMNAKRSRRENLTWWQAFLKAFWSKGSDKKKRGGRGVLKMSGASPNGSERKMKKCRDRNFMKADNRISWADRSQPLRTRSTLTRSERTEPRDVTYLSFRRSTNDSKTNSVHTDTCPPLPLHTGMEDILNDDKTSSNISIANIEKNNSVEEEDDHDIEAVSTPSAKIEKVSDHMAPLAKEDSNLGVSCYSEDECSEENAQAYLKNSH